MSLADIIGQEKAIRVLTGILERQRLANSYIFSGEPGIGKKLTALNFAKAINCLKGSNESEVMSKGLLPPQSTLSRGRLTEGGDSSLISHRSLPVDACDLCEA
ncbi:MAG: hypothetical protein WAV13_05620, partial [Thermodesulfovibrionales bacterium]